MSEFKLYRLIDIIGDKRLGIPPIIPVSRTAWYREIQRGNYPKPVMLTPRVPAWRSTDIDALLKKLFSGAEINTADGN
ncbi:MAG: AlpA family phage regulatory protein [Chlorobiaceae bacterium]